MRAPQRKFVVEIKSRSRKARKASEPASIWGDTDLKALSREVEEQSTDPIPSSLNEPTAMEAEPARTELQVAAPSLADPSPSEGATTSRPHPTATARTDIAPALDGDPDTGRSLAPFARTAGRRGKPPVEAKRKSRSARSATRHQPAGDNSAEVHVTRSGLDDLIAENTYLKTALWDRLSTENRRLQDMLARFS